MTPEDEEFQRISREIRRRAEEDDDIQDYKKPWVGLTDDEIFEIHKQVDSMQYLTFGHAIEAKLKEKNF